MIQVINPAKVRTYSSQKQKQTNKKEGKDRREVREKGGRNHVRDSLRSLRKRNMKPGLHDLTTYK